jgi:histidinol dehydrogenase
MLRLISASDARALAAVVDHASTRDTSIERRVAAILADVKKSGDRAVIAYAKRFDALAGAMEIPRAEIVAGAAQAPASVRRAVRAAAKNIRAVARTQVPKSSKTVVTPGITVEQRVTPLDRVGCYVPGGRYPLPSSLLMTAIPARVAGVREVIAVCPRPEPAVLCAALESGVDRLFRIGGAHAVGAMAFGTATIPRVDKIVGPGNAYVAAAKSLVTRECAIDFHAGPSEIVIVAASGRPGVDRRRPDRAGRTRCRCPRHLHHVEQAAGDAGAQRSRGAAAGRRPRRRGAASQWRHRPHQVDEGVD